MPLERTDLQFAEPGGVSPEGLKDLSALMAASSGRCRTGFHKAEHRIHAKRMSVEQMVLRFRARSANGMPLPVGIAWICREWPPECVRGILKPFFRRPCLHVLGRRTFPPLRHRFRVDAQFAAQLRERSLGSRCCSSDRVCRRGASVTSLSHRPSFHSKERSAPSTADRTAVKQMRETGSCLHSGACGSSKQSLHPLHDAGQDDIDECRKQQASSQRAQCIQDDCDVDSLLQKSSGDRRKVAERGEDHCNDR